MSGEGVVSAAKAAEIYCRQIMVGLDSDREGERDSPRVDKGEVTYQNGGDEVWGVFDPAPPILLLRVAEKDGRGEAVCTLSATPWRVRFK